MVLANSVKWIYEILVCHSAPLAAQIHQPLVMTHPKQNLLAPFLAKVRHADNVSHEPPISECALWPPSTRQHPLFNAIRVQLRYACCNVGRMPPPREIDLKRDHGVGSISSPSSPTYSSSMLLSFHVTPVTFEEALPISNLKLCPTWAALIATGAK